MKVNICEREQSDLKTEVKFEFVLLSKNSRLAKAV